MRIPKLPPFALVVGLLLFISVPALAITDQQRMMLDQLDQLDHQEFVAQTEKAYKCIHSRDFECAEKKIAKAGKYVTNLRDKGTLRTVKEDLAAERRVVQEEIAAAEERARQIKMAEARAIQAEADRRREEKQAREDAANADMWRGVAAIATGTVVGYNARNFSADQQSQLVKASMNAVYNGDTEGFNTALEQVKAERQQENEAKLRAALKERDERAAQAKREREEREEQAMRAQHERNRSNAAARQTQEAERLRLAQANRQPVEVQQYYPQHVTIPTWSQACPPGSSPMRHSNGVNVASAAGAICVKDPENTALANQGADGTSWPTAKTPSASEYAARVSTSGDETSPSSASGTKQKKIEWDAPRMESFAVCRQSTKNKMWRCHGPLDNQVMYDEPTLEGALERQYCAGGTWAAGGPVLEGVQWDAYRCNHSLGHGDYDIVKRYGLISAPRYFICKKGQLGDGRCTTPYDGQDKR